MTDTPITIEAHVARNSDNTLQRKCVPIIFLPGVMGTRLKFRKGGSWDPGMNLSTLSLIFESMEREANKLDYRNGAKLILDNSHLSEAEIERGWGSMVWSFYKKVLRHLDTQKNAVSGHFCPVYALGYDWRQEIYKTAVLGDKDIPSAESRVLEIIEANKAEQCVLVTHSMGGLVVRSMLKNSEKLRGKVAAVIHGAQPVYSAATFYTRFFTGAKSGGGIEGWGLAHIMGNTPAKFARLLSVIASTAEVAPTNHYRDTGGKDWLWRQEDGQEKTPYQGDVYSLYGAATSPPALVDPVKGTRGKNSHVYEDLTKRIKDAKAFHEDLFPENGILYKHENTWAIYGTGHDTDVAAIHHFDRSSTEDSVSYDKTEVVISKDGDGTVPATSASALYPGQASPLSLSPAKTRQYTAEFEHAAAFQSDAVNDCVFEIIQYALTGRETDSQGAGKQTATEVSF